jgi:hypothetical protein
VIDDETRDGTIFVYISMSLRGDGNGQRLLVRARRKGKTPWLGRTQIRE